MSSVIYEELLVSVSSFVDSFQEEGNQHKTASVGCSLNKRSRIKGGKNRANLLAAKVPWLHMGKRMAERQWEKVHSSLPHICRNNCPKEKAERLPCAGTSSVPLS